ncbi:hypothetical protein SO802_006154 [Lithocarpus litseifolius]|uniref:GRF-type domain-containing protein n=1 Tax=Lithocarpus litseifolius TaxID=425828 RepID=A0AAW2DQP0_9ROSI
MVKTEKACKEEQLKKKPKFRNFTHLHLHPSLFSLFSSVVLATPENPGRRFYKCPNYWVGRKCKFFQWRDDEICKHGKVLILEQRQQILTLEADIASYRKREKKLVIYLGLSLVISGMLLYLMLLLVGQIGGGKMGH